MHLFYTPDIAGNTYMLPEEESKHCTRVLRLRVGDQIRLISGKGGLFIAEILDDNPRGCLVKIIESVLEYGKRNHYLHLAVAPTKNADRYEWFLEKATEIGIDEVTPITCEHSERSNIKPERLTKIVISAIKQSLKAYLPRLNQAYKFDAFVKQPFKGQKFIAHCRVTKEPKQALRSVYIPNQHVLIAIGPEGDFSVREIALAVENGFVEITLSAARLRTETAALVACHTVNLLNE
jgi:16S rRNA (uracil1498-N3)-methyltransferase